MGTANVVFCAPACPPFIVALHERGPLLYTANVPDQGMN
jgi:hypothetical protein